MRDEISFRQYCHQKSWWGVAYLVLWGVGIVLLFYTQSYLMPWELPAPQQIIKDSGSFTKEHAAFSPYTFVTDSGSTLYLGCVPDIRSTYCLEGSGNAMRELIGVHVVIGHYRFSYPQWRIFRRGATDMLVSVDRNGQPVYSLKLGLAELARAHAWQLKSRFIAVIGILAGIFVLMLAALISIIKLLQMQERTGHA